MTPRAFQPDSIQRRLSSLKRLLSQLGKLEGIDSTTLQAQPVTMYGVFYMLQQTVELATDINQHLTRSLLGIAEPESRRGFEDLIRAGVLPDNLAVDFRRSSALRNILAHQYTDVNLDIVAHAIPRTIAVYSTYIEAITHWLAEWTL